MTSTSKDLLKLEHQNPSISSIESSLLVCRNDSMASEMKKAQPEGKPIVAPVPKSQVLGKVRDFLGVISEANERLQKDAKENSEKYDIEALTGNESQVIEMDLMLGVADLQTPKAVAAAESAISGYQPDIQLPASSSEEESEDSSDDDSSSDEDDEDSNDDEHGESNDEDIKTSSPVKLKTPKSDKEKSLSEHIGNGRSKKRQKIIELS